MNYIILQKLVKNKIFLKIWNNFFLDFFVFLIYHFLLYNYNYVRVLWTFMQR